MAESGSELYENIVQLNLAASDGEKYNTDCSNTNTQKLKFPDYSFIATFTCPYMHIEYAVIFLGAEVVRQGVIK